MSLAVSANPIRSEEELKLLKEKIDNLQIQLNDNRNQEQSLINDLESIERKLTQLVARQHNQLNYLEALQIRQTELKKELFDLKLANDNALLELGKIVRLSYMLGQQNSIRLVLNQKSPTEIARIIAMYRYFIDSKNTHLSEIRAQQADIVTTSKDIENQSYSVDQAVADLGESKLALQKTANTRQAKLNLVQELLSKDAQQVEIYQKREEELETLLENLRRRDQLVEQSGAISTESVVEAQSRSTIQFAEGGFRKNKGHLLLPTDARIKNRFGQLKSESGLIWEGLMFAVQSGQNVSAIYSGQVVFSDWFRGYGQLLVLDHGDGYMSLYGHNQLLHVELGSSVDAGQLIALAGSTGGLSAPGLYFEIRYNGVPNDPLKWCRL